MPLTVNHRRLKKRARSAETRRSILAAAERAFAKYGLAGARTDAIAAEAGVNKALLYYYFKSKQAIFLAVVDDLFHEFNDEAMKILCSPGSPGQILLRYVGMHFDFISQRQMHASIFQQLMMTGGRPLHNLVQKYFLPRSKAMGDLLDRGMREGEFRKVDRFNTAVSIIALIVFFFSAGPVLQSMGNKDVYSPASLRIRRQEVLDFIRNGLFANESGEG